MRKKSHILLARYLADQMPVNTSLQEHRKAFCLGNILPDIKPSFITKRHEYFGTIDELRSRIAELVRWDFWVGKERVFWRRLGEVMHYLADYFTFPHNKTFDGNLYQHTKYERLLRDRLADYIKSGEARDHAVPVLHFASLKELLDFIRISHDSYLRKARNINEDMNYIVTVCSQVVQGIVAFAFSGRTPAAAV